MPKSGVHKPGLGASIVRALATQLKADLEVIDMKPGTAVRVDQERTGSDVPVDAAPFALRV